MASGGGTLAAARSRRGVQNSMLSPGRVGGSGSPCSEVVSGGACFFMFGNFRVGGCPTACSAVALGGAILKPYENPRRGVAKSLQRTRVGPTINLRWREAKCL